MGMSNHGEKGVMLRGGAFYMSQGTEQGGRAADAEAKSRSAKRGWGPSPTRVSHPCISKIWFPGKWRLGERSGTLSAPSCDLQFCWFSDLLSV